MHAIRPLPRKRAQVTWGLPVGKETPPTPERPAVGGWLRRLSLGLLLLAVYWLLSHGCHSHDEDRELRAPSATPEPCYAAVGQDSDPDVFTSGSES
jgi:hypothetical protein